MKVMWANELINTTSTSTSSSSPTPRTVRVTETTFKEDRGLSWTYPVAATRHTNLIGNWQPYVHHGLLTRLSELPLL